MIIELTPYYDKQGSESNPDRVKSTFNNEIVVSCGQSWDDAISRQKEKLAKLMTNPEPPLPFFIEI